MYSTPSNLPSVIRFTARRANWTLILVATILVGITSMPAGAQALNRPAGENERAYLAADPTHAFRHVQAWHDRLAVAGGVTCTDSSCSLRRQSSTRR
jgi:hypothetical protein